MDFFGAEFEAIATVVGQFFGDHLTASLREKLIIAGIIWWFLKREVSTHFHKIEASMDKIAKNVGELKESLIDLEVRQTDRIDQLDGRIRKLETKE